MKYLLISHKFQETKRGAHFTSERLKNLYPEYIDHVNDIYARDLESLNEQYRKLIFVTQKISMYDVKWSIASLRSTNHTFFLRGQEYPSLFNSCSNGFHYYRQYDKIKNFIPFVTDFQVDSTPKDIPCVGFYLRRLLVKDSHRYIYEFLENCKHKIDLYIMGGEFISPERLKTFKCVNSYKHTTDKKEFFGNITHYIYPMSKEFQDPFPNTVLEAVQNNKQIILPMIPGRNHKDGIDDIQDCIKYHTEFNPDVFYDNSDCILKHKYFRKFYLNLFENDFNYYLDRNKYKRFDKWIEQEVL